MPSVASHALLFLVVLPAAVRAAFTAQGDTTNFCTTDGTCMVNDNTACNNYYSSFTFTGAASYASSQNDASKPAGCSRNGQDFTFNTNAGVAVSGSYTICGLPSDAGTNNAACYYHPKPPPAPPPSPPPPSPPPTSPPNPPPPPPPPTLPPPSSPPPASPPSSNPGAIAGIIVGVLLLLLCMPAAYYGWRELKGMRDERVRQAKWRIKKLFLDMDTDDSGVLEVSELEEMFSWLKVNLPESADGGSHPWIVKMWEALVEVASAPEPTPAAANPATDAEADAPTDSSIVAAPSAAADEEAAIAAEEAISSPAPPLPSGAQLSRTQSIHAVEGASLTLEAFVKWYNRVTSEFKPDVRTKVLETLEDYVAKMCKADRLFKLWDHDDSGTLDYDEIVSVLSWFEKHIPGDDIEFATIWDADKEADTAHEEPEEPDAAPATAAPAAATAADEEPETAENAKSMEDPEAPEAPPPAPVAVTGKAVKRVPLRKMFNPMTAVDNAFAGFPEWIASVVASLTPVGDADPDTATPTMNPMALFFQSDTKANLKLTLVQFRRWLMSVAGQLEASTYAAALDQLCEIAVRHVTAQQIFGLWDKDGSGELEFGELRNLFAWLKANVPPQEGFNYSTLWDELPDSGKCDIATFDDWLLTVTKKMKPEGFHELQEKIKARLAELQSEEEPTKLDSKPIDTSIVESASAANGNAPAGAAANLDA